MKRKEVAVRREEILLAALDQVRLRGIAGVRAADVAKNLDVSTALIFYHFGTLEALLIEAFRQAAERNLAVLRDELAHPGPVRGRLRAVLALYGPTEPAAGWHLWIEAGAAAMRDAELREVVQRLDLRWRDAVVSLLSEGVAAGEFRCPDPHGAAWRLTALLDGLAVQFVARKGTVTSADCTRWIGQALAHELGETEPALLAEDDDRAGVARGGVDRSGHRMPGLPGDRPAGPRRGERLSADAGRLHAAAPQVSERNFEAIQARFGNESTR